MTTPIRRLALASLALAWFVLPAIGHAAACATSTQSLHGWYGMLISGTNTSDGSVKYLAGAVLFDGAGNLSGNNVYGTAGTDTSASGTYVLNSDCSLTLTMKFGSSTAQVYTVGVRTSTNEAVGVEVDSLGVATIDLQAQYSTYTTGLNFTSASANGTFAANCIGPGVSDLNLVTFANGTLTGTDAYNDNGTLAVANTPYSGSYSVNSDGTFTGSLVILGTTFDFYGVLSNANAKIEYFYSNVSGGVATNGFASCTGGLAPSGAPNFSLSPAANTLSVNQGSSGSDAISVSPVNGFNGTVSFTASGLPQGASALFNPASSPSATTLTVTTTSTTPPGTYPILITGTSTVAGVSTAQTTTVSLTVNAAGNGEFTLSPASATLTLQPNSGGTDRITVTPINGFRGFVSLAVSALPSGVSGWFQGDSLMIFASATAAAGSFPLTVTGTSGNAKATTTITLVVTAGPTFTLSAASASLTLSSFGVASDTISVIPANGFDAAVEFSASGLPPGVFGNFSPGVTTNRTTFTVYSYDARSGSYPITITGTSAGWNRPGGTTSKTTITLQIR